MQRFVAEFFGTFFLVLAIGLTGNAVATGLFVVALVYITGRISGAHFNPAVTIAFWASRGMHLRLVGQYLISQFTGAFLGAVAIFYLSGSAYQAIPSPLSTPIQYTLVELGLTIILAMVYLTLFLSKEFRHNRIYGMVIGMTYAGLLVLGEPVSGSIFNPALATGTSIIDYFDFGNSWMYLPVYLITPCIGGIIAGYLFNYFERNSS
ncbi:MAG: MIP/aquaporin family protein [Balneolaceae bacterium]